MTSRISFLGGLLLACLLAFVAAVVMIVLATSAEQEARNQSRLSRDIVDELNHIVAESLTAESGQRGYLLTGDQFHFDDYEAGVEHFENHLASLETRMGDAMTASQRQNLDALKIAGDAKNKELAATLDLYRAGDAEGALKLVNTNTGVELMSDLQSAAQALQVEEQAILDRSRNVAQTTRRLGAASILFLCVLALIGFVVAYRNLHRSKQLDVVEQQAMALADEREKSDLLARELSHRVKNLFSIVQSIISATARQETDARVAAAKIRERIHALSRAHSLTSSLDMQQQTSLDELVSMIVAAQVTGTSTLNMAGPPIVVTAQHVTPLGMILHELTTNAVKYGAWSGEDGRIDISWSVHQNGKGPELALNWQEVCPPGPNRGSLGPDGFGSRMINMSLAQLSGESVRDWKSAGLHVKIVLPLDDHGVVRGRNSPAD